MSERNRVGEESRGTGRSAFSVGGGIFLSRITGFARDLAFAAFFGTGLAADAFSYALKIPNIIRNLLGEGTLSAAFVPAYSHMLEDGEGGEGAGAGEEAGGEAHRLARAMLGTMLVVAALLSALGVLLAPWITRAVAPGLVAEGKALTTELVRILFPMAGAFMVAAWALGVLNSHRRFFLPFVAPVAWNLTQVAGLLLGARMGWDPLIHVLAWSALVGGLLQLGIQLPAVRRLMGGSVTPRLDWSWEPLRRVIRNMGPVAASQGVWQVASLAEALLASFVGQGAMASLYFAQRIVYLPLSLFGISVAAAALPEMSRERAADYLQARLANGFFQILFFVLPSAVAMILFGDLMVQVLFQRMEFGAESAARVTAILITYSMGVVASSAVKLFASGFHARGDTRTPMKITAVAVGVGVASSAVFMIPLGTPGIALGGAVGAWLNLVLLWRSMRRRIGEIFTRSVLGPFGRIVAASVVGGGAGVLARHALEGWMDPSQGTLAAAAVLAGTLLAAGVPYLAIARKPPRVVPRPASHEPSHEPS